MKSKREQILKLCEFEKWFQCEHENAKKCCESCSHSFLNAEVNMRRAFNAKNEIIKALIEENEQLRAALEKISQRNFSPKHDGLDPNSALSLSIRATEALTAASPLDDILKGEKL